MYLLLSFLERATLAEWLAHWSYSLNAFGMQVHVLVLSRPKFWLGVRLSGLTLQAQPSEIFVLRQ